MITPCKYGTEKWCIYCGSTEHIYSSYDNSAFVTHAPHWCSKNFRYFYTERIFMSLLCSHLRVIALKKRHAHFCCEYFPFSVPQEENETTCMHHYITHTKFANNNTHTSDFPTILRRPKWQVEEQVLHTFIYLHIIHLSV